jgi:hypothetical protein
MRMEARAAAERELSESLHWILKISSGLSLSLGNQ